MQNLKMVFESNSNYIQRVARYIAVFGQAYRPEIKIKIQFFFLIYMLL